MRQLTSRPAVVGIEAELGVRRAEEPDPMELALTAERERLVRGVLQGLSARDLEVLRLHHAEGCSKREIGRRLGMPESTIRASMERAMQRLRRDLAAA